MTRPVPLRTADRQTVAARLRDRAAAIRRTATRDHRTGHCSAATADRNARPLPEALGVASGATATPSTTAPTSARSGRPRGVTLLLLPPWAEAFMGFPAGWTDPGDAPDGPVPAYAPPGSTH